MAKNTNLHKAKESKNDEFYTQFNDVANELKHYKHHFKDKIVLCNCDDPSWSAFWKYFHLNFSELGLKKLVSTHYVKEVPVSKLFHIDTEAFSYKMTYDGGNDEDIMIGTKTKLDGNGDFRSEECIKILEEADIVCTNPPFSLFREYVTQLMEYGKKFVIIGNKSAYTYKELFPFFMNDEMWMGYRSSSSEFYFNLPNDKIKEIEENRRIDPLWRERSYIKQNGVYVGRVPACFYTNLDFSKRHEKLILWKQYNEKEYPKYDNYDAIDVSKTNEIPSDYYEAIGVPVSFLDKHCPEQFKIIGQTNFNGTPTINGRNIYTRILIKRKDVNA